MRSWRGGVRAERKSGRTRGSGLSPRGLSNYLVSFTVYGTTCLAVGGEVEEEKGGVRLKNLRQDKMKIGLVSLT